MKLAYLFPGQGSQAVGMGRALAERHPAARAAFETADRVVGFGLSGMWWEGAEAELKLTKNAQPALLAHSVAALRVLDEALAAARVPHEPVAVAGHSLGEYSACVAAGALEYEDALRLVRTRGELMYRAGVERPGTMAAILGLDAEAVAEVCREAGAAGVVVPANHNAPGQIVISGEVAAVQKACEIARAKGAKRAIPLPVSGAFHSPLMESAAQGLRAAIHGVTIRDPRVPIVSNVEARWVRTAQDVRTALGEQLLRPVHWEQSMRKLRAVPVDRFVEIGTGRVLRGLLKTLDPDAESLNVGEPDDLDPAVNALRGTGQPAAKGGA